jgi:hypothetical protein
LIGLQRRVHFFFLFFFTIVWCSKMAIIWDFLYLYFSWLVFKIWDLVIQKGVFFSPYSV